MQQLKHLVLVAVLASGVQAADAPPPVAVDALVALQSFSLTESFQPSWLKDSGPVSEGWLVVVAADPQLVKPRQTTEPLLFAGSTLAFRLSLGWTEGHYVAMIPGSIDLTTVPLYFASPGLPEALDGKARESVYQEALRNELKPRLAIELELARAAAGATVNVANMAELAPHLKALVDAYAPDEILPPGR